MQTFTDLTISKLKPPPTGQRSYWDSSLRGFGIRVSCGGSKSWVVQVGPQRKLITLSRYPSVSLKEARIEAKRHLAAPVDTTKSITLDVALILFIRHCEATLRPRTVQSYRTSLYRHLTERNGSLRSWSTDRLMKIIEALANTPSEQLHFFNICRTFLNFCVQRKILQTNPLGGLPTPSKRNTRKRVLSDDELKKVWLAAELDTITLSRIIQICILTGVRRGEVSKFDWSYIDQKKRLITLPATITKNHIEHCFPYGDLLQKVLDTFTVQTGKLFPGRTQKNEFYEGWSRGKEDFDLLCPIAHWTLHDIRRSFYTNMAALGVAPHICAKLVNHVSGAQAISGISAVYNRHLYLDEQRAAIQLWENKLGSLVG
jgi:integrase